MVKFFVLIGISLMLAFQLFGCQTTNSTNKQKASLHLQIGMSHYKAGLYPQALSEILKAHQLDKNNPAILNNLGLAYFMRGKPDLAEKYLRQALQADPKFTDSRNNLVRVLIERKDFTTAQNEMDKVLADLTYGGLDRAYLNQGLIYFNQSKFPAAEKYFAKSVEAQKDDCIARNYLARSIFEQSHYARAAAAFDKAIAFCQKILFDEPHYYSALAYFRAGDRDRAKIRFQEITRIYPNGKYLEKSRQMLELLEKVN
jgi:Tfp pilus assembly protein PilF